MEKRRTSVEETLLEEELLDALANALTDSLEVIEREVSTRPCFVLPKREYIDLEKLEEKVYTTKKFYPCRWRKLLEFYRLTTREKEGVNRQ